MEQWCIPWSSTPLILGSFARATRPLQALGTLPYPESGVLPLDYSPAGMREHASLNSETMWWPLSPNPPMDGVRALEGGVRELQARWSGLEFG